MLRQYCSISIDIKVIFQMLNPVNRLQMSYEKNRAIYQPLCASNALKHCFIKLQ